MKSTLLYNILQFTIINIHAKIYKDTQGPGRNDFR